MKWAWLIIAFLSPVQATGMIQTQCSLVLSQGGRALETHAERFLFLAQLLTLVKTDPAAANEAWTIVVSDFTPDLRAYFRWREAREDLIDDLVQETFVRMLIKVAGFQAGEDPAASARRFLYGLAKVVLLSQKTARPVGLLSSSFSCEGSEAEFEAGADGTNCPIDFRTIAELLESEGQRGVMSLFLQSYTIDEIAVALKLSPSQVRELYQASVSRVRTVMGVPAPNDRVPLTVPFTREQARLLRLRATGAGQVEISAVTALSTEQVNQVLSRDVRRKVAPVLVQAGIVSASEPLWLRDFSFQVDPFDPAIIHITYQNRTTGKTTRIEGRDMDQHRVRLDSYVHTEDEPVFPTSSHALPRVLMHFKPDSQRLIEKWALGKTIADIAFESGTEIGRVREVIQKAARRAAGDWYEITQSDFEWITAKMNDDRRSWAKQHFYDHQSPYEMERRGLGQAKTIYMGLHQVSELLEAYAVPTTEPGPDGVEGTRPLKVDIWHLVVVPDNSSAELNRITLRK
jgi:DNA-directed RNA polymerase specialized sigma24 family protein